MVIGETMGEHTKKVGESEIGRHILGKMSPVQRYSEVCPIQAPQKVLASEGFLETVTKILSQK